MYGKVFTIYKDRRIDPSVLTVNWYQFTDKMKYDCYIYQAVPIDLIESEWYNMSEIEKSICILIQDLPICFIATIYHTLTDKQRTWCLAHQKSLKVITIEDMVPLFTCKDLELREYALNKYKGVIYDYSNLPSN